MRQNLRVVAVALLCVLVIGFAAATLSNPVDPGAGDGEGPGQGPGANPVGESEAPGTDDQQGQTGGRGVEQEESFQYCYQPLDGEPIWAPLIAGTLVVGFAVTTLFDRIQGLKAMFLFFWPFLIVLLILTAGCDPPPTTRAVTEAVNSTAGNASGQSDGGGDRSFTTPTSIIAVLFVVAALGLAAAVVLRDDGEETQVRTEPEMDEEQQQAAIGAAAGEAADRIEAQAGLENEVYRAWAEMAEPLPVEQPQTSTPAEFAAAAQQAGIRPDDVAELTELFEEVRYGTASPTADREERAVEALRRIERAYGDDQKAEE